jgi:hypothetical protein
VDARAHQIVHQIIAFGDAFEDSADQLPLLTLGHAAEAEIGVGACIFITHRARRYLYRHVRATEGKLEADH